MTPKKKRDGFILRTLLKSKYITSRRRARALLIAVCVGCISVTTYNLVDTFTTWNDTVYREDIPRDVLEQIPAEKRESLPSRSDAQPLSAFIKQAFAEH